MAMLELCFPESPHPYCFCLSWPEEEFVGALKLNWWGGHCFLHIVMVMARGNEKLACLLSLLHGLIFFQMASTADQEVHQAHHQFRCISSSLQFLSRSWSYLMCHCKLQCAHQLQCFGSWIVTFLWSPYAIFWFLLLQLLQLSYDFLGL